jgi:hypothetical protein
MSLVGTRDYLPGSTQTTHAAAGAPTARQQVPRSRAAKAQLLARTSFRCSEQPRRQR